MISKFNKQPLIHKIMTIAIFLFAVFFLYRCTSNMVLNLDYVREYREAADVQLTKAFLTGDNPYRLKSLDSNRTTPPVLYQYSFFNSVVSAAMSFLCGGNVVLAHYLVALLAMIGSGIIIFLLLNRYISNTTLPMLGALLSLFCHWRFGYLSTTPNSLGLFLTLLTFWLALSGNGRGRTFLIGVLTVLLFYTKLYYVSIAASILIYRFLSNRKSALQYLLACIITGLGSVLLISLIWPLYFTYSIYFINGMGLNLVPRVFKTQTASVALPVLSQVLLTDSQVFLTKKFNVGPAVYVLTQYAEVIKAFAPVFVMFALGVVAYALRKAKSKAAAVEPVNNSAAENAAPEARENTLAADCLRLAVIQMIVQGLWLCVLGRSNGTYLTYHLQLWMPYVILASLLLFSQVKGFNSKLINYGIIGLFVVSAIFFGYRKLPMHIMTEEERTNWQKAREYITNYENDQDGQYVYYVPELAYFGLDLDKNVYDNGHTAVASEKGLKKWQADPLAQKMFPYAGEIAELHLAYQQELIRQVEDHKLKLVTTDDTAFLMNEELLTANGYHKLDTLPLSVGNVTYDVTFWTTR